MKALKALIAAVAVATGMLVIPVAPASAQYCSPTPPDTGGITQGDYNPSGVGQVDPRYSVPQYLEWAVRDADQMWSDWFVRNGLCEPEVGYVLLGYNGINSYQSNCTDPKGKRQPPVGPSYANAFYCSVDVTVGSNGHQYVGTVVLPVITFRNMWFGNIFGKESRVMGDFAAGGIVAHEFGHHVTDEMQQQLKWKRPAGKNNELIADCFSGVWTWSINQRGILEYGDLDEIVAALEQMGDPHVSTNSHGTAAERKAAMATGFNSGNPMTCINTYWK